MTTRDEVRDGVLARLRAIDMSEKVRQREGSGGSGYDYLAWEDVRDALNENCEWDWQARVEGGIPESAVVRGTLTIEGDNGKSYSRDGIGEQAFESKSKAPPFECAERAAFKRAASLFGIEVPEKAAPSPRTRPAGSNYIAPNRPQAGQTPPPPPPTQEQDTTPWLDCPQCGQPKRKAAYKVCYECNRDKRAQAAHSEPPF